MQNIDPFLILEPLVALLISAFLVVYWRRRRSLRGAVIALSFVAYAGAIMAKIAVQDFTLSAVTARFGPVSVGLGLYYGLQTVFAEVGLAYALAVYGTKRVRLNSSEGAGYGISLAFWENGVLLGAIPLLNFSVAYILIASGSSIGQAVYTAVMNSQPADFLPPSALLWSELLGILERASSMLTHIAWGVLCLLAAATQRKRFLAYALPMGLVDALVPFATLNLNLFEAVVFALSVVFLLVAWAAARQASSVAPTPGTSVPEPAPNTPS